MLHWASTALFSIVLTNLCRNAAGIRPTGLASFLPQLRSTTLNAQWSVEGYSQLDLMNHDECIVVDENDMIIGHTSKYEAHRFDQVSAPSGVLHRAFSVFLFNNEGKLLLQQRASSKITFPNVWTNTCCSHPLYGYQPSEVDDEESVAMGKVQGTVAAARRKLNHELGICSEDVPSDDFKYLGRLHYCAADTNDKSWGEHEIDYILFIRKDVSSFDFNSEEIQNVKYVTLQELQAMMDPSSGLLWSPWFKIIVDKFLVKWWSNLDKTFTTDELVDLKTIHKF